MHNSVFSICGHSLLQAPGEAAVLGRHVREVVPHRAAGVRRLAHHIDKARGGRGRQHRVQHVRVEGSPAEPLVVGSGWIRDAAAVSPRAVRLEEGREGRDVVELRPAGHQLVHHVLEPGSALAAGTASSS